MRHARLITIPSLYFLLCTAPYTPSGAQTPTLTIAFDEIHFSPHGFCRGAFVADTIAVVARNFNMYMSTVEFGIEPPTINASYMGDVQVYGALALGNSVTTGVWITYPSPLNAFSPVVVMRIAIMWLCNGCGHDDAEFPWVMPNQTSGLLRAVEWETYRLVDGFGKISTICFFDATEPSTWGKVKALYR
jgi:hypothetical protein